MAGELESASPRDRAIADCLGRTYAGLGELSLQADRTEEAVNHFLHVVALAEKSAELNPNYGQAQGTLLEAYFRLGRAYGFHRDLDRADIWFRKMHDLAEKWAALEPDNILARDLLATSFRKLGDIRKLAGDDLAARAEYAQAIVLGRKLLLADPANRDVKLHLALALDDQAMTLRRLGRLEEAGPLSRQAEQLFIELVQTDPEDIDNRMRLLQTQFHCGCIEMDQFQIKAAAAHLRACARWSDCASKTTASSTATLATGRSCSRHSRRSWQPVKPSPRRPGTSDALRSRSAREAIRLLRIRAAVLADEGRLVEFAATAEAMCGLDAHKARRLVLSRPFSRLVCWPHRSDRRAGRGGAGPQDRSLHAPETAPSPRWAEPSTAGSATRVD